MAWDNQGRVVGQKRGRVPGSLLGVGSEGQGSGFGEGSGTGDNPF